MCHSVPTCFTDSAAYSCEIAPYTIFKLEAQVSQTTAFFKLFDPATPGSQDPPPVYTFFYGFVEVLSVVFCQLSRVLCAAAYTVNNTPPDFNIKLIFG